MSRTRVKICGITRPEDAIAAADLGADAIGLVFYPASPRVVKTADAKRIVAALPPFVSVVGLFVNAEPETVDQILSQVPLHLLQFHGDEDPAYCAAFGIPFIKAVPMGQGADVVAYARRFKAAAGLLVDSHGGSHGGGSGRCFDWELIPPNIHKPLILAGGLNPRNVATAVQRVQPFAVDVSSGVEIVKGIKDNYLMRAFIEAVQSGESRV